MNDYLPQDFIMDLVFRKATDNDYEFCERIHHEGMKPYVEPVWGWDEEFQRERYRRLWKPEKIKVFASDNEDIGYLEVEEKGNIVKIANIFVNSGHRNRGIGTKVINDFVENSKNNYELVTLNVMQNNPAQKLYERLGFKFISKNDQMLIYELNLNL